MMSQVVVFDPYSDLTVRVGGKDGCAPQLFEVCSRTLARASPVFDRMLFGPFAESVRHTMTSEGSNWVIELPNDKPAPLKLLMSIIHADFSKIPCVLSVEELYDLTVMTDYYDTTPLLEPWMDTWICSIQELIDDANDLMPKMLWISWQFGNQEVFETTANRMMLESKGSWASTESEIMLPPDIIERIEAIRTQTISTWFDMCRQLVEDLTVVDERPRCCHHATFLGPHRCESMILGSLTFCLTRAGLWPLPDAKDLRLSILGLYRSLTNLVIHDIGRCDGQSDLSHAECNPSAKLFKQFRTTMSEIPRPVTEFHEEHFRKLANARQQRTNVAELI